MVNHLEYMASCGYGYSRSEIIDLASVYAVSLNKRDLSHPFSKAWFDGFMKRWPQLKLRKPR